jgi:hypothetical protein
MEAIRSPETLATDYRITRRQKLEDHNPPQMEIYLSVGYLTALYHVYLSQDISELRWPLQINTLVASQPT